MQIKPHKWTHYHTQRLYHISMLMTWVFIVVVVIYGIFAFLLQAEADQATTTATVSATVPGIESGPTTPVGGGGGPIAYAPTQNSATTSLVSISQPNVTIKAIKHIGNKNVIISGQQVYIALFDNPYPSFTGTTNIKNADIFLEIYSYQTIRGTTYADDNGNWSWQSPEVISSGQHTVTVTAQDPVEPAIQASGSLNFFINAKTGSIRPNVTLIVPSARQGGTLFDVLAKIPEQFKVVAPGDDLVVSINLINFGFPGRAVDVGVQYTITGPSGEVVLQSSETMAVATKVSVLKTFYTSPVLKNGIYTLTVRVPSKDVIATSADTFELKGSPIFVLGNRGKIDFTLVFQAFGGLLLLFSLVVYFEYNKVSVLSKLIRKVDEQDLRLYNY